MEEPKKNSPSALKVTKEEAKRNEAVRKNIDDAGYQSSLEKVVRVRINNSGTAKPVGYEKKVIKGGGSAGSYTKIVDSKGNVVSEARVGTANEKEMLRANKAKEGYTQERRQKSADVVNYQTGKETVGNRVYDEKMKQQKQSERLKVRVAK